MVNIRSAVLALSLGFLMAGPASADVLLMDSVQSSPRTEAPRTGLNMDSVRTRFGNPATEHPAVSTEGNPLHPPITRWDYDGYSVFFENDLVLHSVVYRTPAN
jgi:hypothetical protein